jgi:hypothetical protein
VRIGWAALIAVVLMVVGLAVYGVADLRFGGYVAVAGFLLACGAIVAAHVWEWTNDDDFG